MTSLGYKHTDATKAKIAAGNRRRFADPAAREKIAAANRRRYEDPAEREKTSALQRGNRNHNWQGDNIDYHTAHLRHGNALTGQPCAHAGNTCKGRLENALNHDTPKQFVKIDPLTGYRYSTRPEDYIRLCTAHHARYDLTTHCRRGHEFTPENTYVYARKPRTRHCRECRRCQRARRANR